MSTLPPILLSLCLLAAASLRAQDVGTQYLKLQESYTQRVEDITQRYQKSKRELLNKFILALVRREQNYRETADLDGVVFCRDLRESLLLKPVFPGRVEGAPEGIADMLDSLHEKKQALQSQHQHELDQLNLMLHNALTPYETEFIRQGMAGKAEEIAKLQEVLESYKEQMTAKDREKQTLTSSLTADPNSYPFAIEGSGYGEIRGVTPRTCMITLTPELEGVVKETPLGYRLVNGRVTYPANETGPLLQDLVRNGLFSAEIAFQPDFDFEGFPRNPVILFQLGKNKDSALFSITMEGRNLCLYFKTDQPPADRENHHYQIGDYNSPGPLHLVVTYRPGELTAYLNGEARLQLRNEVNGTLKEWQPVEVVIGKAFSHPNDGFILPFRGVLNHVYLKAGDMTSRQVVASYNRYLLLFE